MFLTRSLIIPLSLLLSFGFFIVANKNYTSELVKNKSDNTTTNINFHNFRNIKRVDFNQNKSSLMTKETRIKNFSIDLDKDINRLSILKVNQKHNTDKNLIIDSLIIVIFYIGLGIYSLYDCISVLAFNNRRQ